MSEYHHVEKPFLDQLATLGWTVIDQGHGFIPSDPAAILRETFREWLLPEVFRDSARRLLPPFAALNQLMQRLNPLVLEQSVEMHVAAGIKVETVHPFDGSDVSIAPLLAKFTIFVSAANAAHSGCILGHD
jgi:hypothetical protein